MAEKLLVIDTSTGAYKSSGVAVSEIGAGRFYDFDVGGGGQSAFIIGEDITVDSVVVVLINGREGREGGSYDYTINAATDTVTFNYTVPNLAWVRVKVY